MKMIPDLSVKNLRKQSVLLGFSGGADSAAAVILLKKKGYHVVGLHLSMLYDGDTVREEKKHVDDIAQQLNIQVLHQDMSGQFEENIIDPFCQAYISGKTPNPCVLCNPNIKFNALYTAAQEMGFPQIATGHYARIHNTSDGKYFIRRAKNLIKDQSYMLYRLPTEVLAHVIFPLGGIESKDHIRSLLKDYKISNAETKDSQDICFIKNASYKDFLSQRGGFAPLGNYVDKNGHVLGQHLGISSYTIGQRKGLGKAFGKPTYVIGVDQTNNTVVLGGEKELYKKIVSLSDLYFTIYGDCKNIPPIYMDCEIQAKIRYPSKLARAFLTQENDTRPMLKFFEPQRSPTPGQSAVIYDDDIVIGGGLIV